jgi:small-conductance mechanosensitive channel
MVTVALILQFIWWGLGAIDYWVQRRIQAEQDQGSSKTTLNAVRIVLQVTLWSIGILLILQNVTGLDMNALLAALGVGGIAVALAVQNILGDLFSSISISLDKPFVIGDNIAIDNYIGTVEYIGLKSTRLRSISGEELIISNSDLLSSRIRNFERQERRRVVGTARVSYNTGSDKLERIPDLIKAIITTQDQVIFDRAHLKEFGDFGFVFEYVYFLESADIHLFMDRQQVINLAITRILEDQGVQFAALVQPPENPKVQ